MLKQCAKSVESLLKEAVDNDKDFTGFGDKLESLVKSYLSNNEQCINLMAKLIEIIGFKGVQQNSSNLFVKFVRYNDKTISSLINKTVKFSTVNEFNDFNELRDTGNLEPDTSVKKVIIEALSNIRKRIEIIGYARLTYKYNKGYLAGFEKRLNAFDKIGSNVFFDENNKINDWPLLTECFVYSIVGIFCISSLEVFKDDSAQLMFAHYAENLKGLALVYGINASKLKPIKYTHEILNSDGRKDRAISYSKGIFDDVDGFTCKSRKWRYETEYRMFGNPGIYTTEDIKLKAILYTPRFAGDVELLKKINSSFYNGTLILEEIEPNTAIEKECECFFKIENKRKFMITSLIS